MDVYNFDDYTVGGNDTTGKVIEKIIDHRETKYIIYFTKGNYIDAELHQGLDSGLVFSEKFLSLLTSISELHIPNKKKYSFVRIAIADAVKNLAQGYEELAISNLEKSIRYKKKA